MAPPPEYDKEPKAPDKSATSISCQETKALHNLVNDQQTNADNKPEKTTSGGEVENNKHVETLDDGQLRALLDEAITYKCPKDREGKSSLFKELLEEVEQDEQACEEAARGLSGGRRGRTTQGRGRRALPHSNSLQDLVAALAAEPAPRHGRNRHHHNSSHHHSSHHHPPPVSARAIHGGSLPSGVDTSFLLGEEPTTTRGSVGTGAGGYLATVRCVNPPPLAERRVSASDANCASEVELLNRRSKPTFPMTYTARATLEIGSGSVCSGRATTTTTASNQVRTSSRAPRTPRSHRLQHLPARIPALTVGPPERLYQKKLYNPVRKHFMKPRFYAHRETDCTLDEISKVADLSPNVTSTMESDDEVSDQIQDNNEQDGETSKLLKIGEDLDSKQCKLLSALFPKTNCDKGNNNGGGSNNNKDKTKKYKEKVQRGPNNNKTCPSLGRGDTEKLKLKKNLKVPIKGDPSSKIGATKEVWMKQVDSWYESLANYSVDTQVEPAEDDNPFYQALFERRSDSVRRVNTNSARGHDSMKSQDANSNSECLNINSSKNFSTGLQNITLDPDNWSYSKSNSLINFPFTSKNHMKRRSVKNNQKNKELYYYDSNSHDYHSAHWTNESTDGYRKTFDYIDDDDLVKLREQYRVSVGNNLVVPTLSINPKNVRSMTIGKPVSFDNGNDFANKFIENTNQDLREDDNDLNITQTVNKPNETNVFTNTNGSKCDDILEEIGTTKIRNWSVKTNASEPLQDNTSNRIVDSETKLEDGVGNVVSFVSKLEHIDDLRKEVRLEISTDTKENNEAKTVDEKSMHNYDSEIELKYIQVEQTSQEDSSNEVEMIDFSLRYRDKGTTFQIDNGLQLVDLSSKQTKHMETDSNQVELKEISPERHHEDNTRYFAEQQKLFHVLEISNVVDSDKEHSSSFLDVNNEKVQSNLSTNQTVAEPVDVKEVNLYISEVSSTEINQIQLLNVEELTIEECSKAQLEFTKVLIQISTSETVNNEQYVIAELPSNACILLTNPIHSVSTATAPVKLQIENNNKLPGKKSKKRKEKSEISKKEAVNKNALRALLLEQLFKNDDKVVGKGTVANNEVDSAIPFSCITTPEVVASCNTTSSTSQSAVAVDPKPLQLESSYRAVTSLTGPPLPAHAQPLPAASLPDLAAQVPPFPSPGPEPTELHPRSVISSSFNGLPLSRPSYGSTASTASDEFKKSLDENGNSVQGFSSPLSGSSQHKKPRRKKSSKNETVITSHEINGYQGNKDLNEVLRFIESNAEGSRAQKLPRAKHKDDSDDKSGKKRSAERRKDKESKMKRATSMEELSRTKLEDLTDKPKKERRADAPVKAERRSWGDDARDAFYFRDDEEAAPAPDADFQTVTKKRKPRRREPEPDAAAGDPPRPARGPSPRARRVSAPPSDRSNDSNDDMDSVHSLQSLAAPDAAPPPLPASYADIARTRHNIPDLIESCNFYPDEPRSDKPDRVEPPPAKAPSDQYPALEPRSTVPAARKTPSALPPKTQTPAPPKPHRKERGSLEAREADCPAPDVVADRRPPVILLDSTTRPRDMDGVTFGFDINEQLLSGGPRRPRCDLVRDAMEGADGVGAGAGVAGGVAVLAGCAALRYVPPAPPPDTLHLHQIIDYVGAAWEDVVRCGGGKVRYFSE